jgi:hypothetical protein
VARVNSLVASQLAFSHADAHSYRPTHTIIEAFIEPYILKTFSFPCALEPKFSTSRLHRSNLNSKAVGILSAVAALLVHSIVIHVIFIPLDVPFPRGTRPMIRERTPESFPPSHRLQHNVIIESKNIRQHFSSVQLGILPNSGYQAPARLDSATTTDEFSYELKWRRQAISGLLALVRSLSALVRCI